LEARTINAREKTVDETALDLLEAAYNHAVTTVDEGQSRLLFRANDAANALGLTTAERDTPEAEAYRRAISLLVDSGAMLREAGRIA